MSTSRPSGRRRGGAPKARHRKPPRPPVKITAPAPPDAYPRARLFARLDRACDSGRIAWISGPAGAGKTTLVVSYIEARKLPCLWYRADEGDHDLASFFHYIGLAVTRASPRFRRPLPKFTPEYVGGGVTFARNFFRELVRRLRVPFALVLDDLHEIERDSELHAVLCAGLGELPPGAHAIIMSRESPPGAYARQRLHRRISEIDWRELRLGEKESRELARFIGATPEEISNDTVDELNRRCDGWIAGLILLLQTSSAADSGRPGSSPSSPQALFDYFAAEVFARRPPAVRDFLTLTALFPAFTTQMAMRLTGSSSAGALLDDLVRRHHFTERHSESPGTYHFHPLFRDFLLARGRAAWGVAETMRQQRRAAVILEEAGEIEEALPLYLAAGDVDGAARSILAAAEEIANEGRHATLAAAISKLPESVVGGDGWLLYWRAISRSPACALEARADLEAAYALFDARGDATGLYAAWAAIVQSYFAEYRNYLPVDPWIAALESLRRRFPAYPSDRIEAQVLNAAVGALAQRFGEHPLLPELNDRLEAIIEAAATPRERALLAVHPVLYHTVLGRTERARRLVDLLEADVRQLADDPVARLARCNCAAMVEWHQGNPRKALGHVEEGLGIVEAHGLPVLKLMILFHGGYASLACGDFERAERFIEQMRAVAAGRDDIHAAVYHQFLSMAAAHRGDLARAEKHGETSVRLAEDKGVPFGYFCNAYSCAVAAFMRGDEAKGTAMLENARKVGVETGSRYVELVCRLADCAFKLSGLDGDTARARLRAAFALSRELGGPSVPWLPHRVLAQVYAMALDFGIEREHVKQLIEKLEVTVTEDVLHTDAWPWPIKIYTLGRFSVVIGTEPIQFSGKAQKKPLELLKTLVAFGGRSVREEKVAAAIWPDADSSRAALSLTTTLHRLRKLIGGAAIERREGRLSLDARVCWVDAWALERQLTAAERSCRAQGHEAILSQVDKLSRLYHGPFLDDHDEHTWLLSRRTRLQARFLRTLATAAEALARAGRHDDAVRCLERALEADPVAEDVYRRLMRAQLACHRRAEALSTYRNCRRMLARHFGLEPSPETEALRRRIDAG